jgi:hypothetical protein
LVHKNDAEPKLGADKSVAMAVAPVKAAAEVPLQVAPAIAQVTVAAWQLPGAVSTTGPASTVASLFLALAAAEAVGLGSSAGSEPLPQPEINETAITKVRRVKHGRFLFVVDMFFLMVKR